MRNMLLVDDQREERNGIKYLIEKFNFPIKTYEAANGLEALEILQSQKIDILLTDVKMPLMDGIALVSQVNQDFPQVIRIIFSSYGEFDYAKGAMEANVRYYLLKPIEIEEFAKVINEALKELATRELKEKNQSQEELTRSLSRLFMNSKIGNWPLQISSILDEYLQGKQLQLLELDFPTELTELERSMVIKQFDQFKEASKFYVKIDNKTLFILLVSTKRFVKERVRDFASRSIIHLKQTQKIYPRIIVMEEVDQLPLFLRKLTKLEKYHREFLLAQNQLYPETEIEEYKEDRRPFDIHLEACLNAIGRKENHELAAAFSQLAKLIDRQVILTTSLAQQIFFELSSTLEKTYFKQLPKSYNTGWQSITDFSHSLMKVTELYQGLAQQGQIDISRQILNYIERNYLHDISLEDIANDLNFSSSHLSVLYKQETGRTIMGDLANFRLKKAKQLLDTTNLKVIQIAEKVGYKNHSYFDRVFKKQYGVTPNHYRKMK